MTQESETKKPNVVKESWTSFLLPIALIFGLVLLLSLNTDISGVGEGTEEIRSRTGSNSSSGILRRALKLRRRS